MVINKKNASIFRKILLTICLVSSIFHFYKLIQWLSYEKGNLPNSKVEYVLKKVESTKEPIFKRKVADCCTELTLVSKRKRAYQELWVTAEIRYHLILSLISISVALFLVVISMIKVESNLTDDIIEAS